MDRIGIESTFRGVRNGMLFGVNLGVRGKPRASSPETGISIRTSWFFLCIRSIICFVGVNGGSFGIRFSRYGPRA